MKTFLGDPIDKLVPAPAIDARPMCPGCGTRLKPYMYKCYADAPALKSATARDVGKTWSGRYHGYPPFHSMRCGLQFARDAHAAGFRRKGRKP